MAFGFGDTASNWDERRELTRHFIEAIRPSLQVVYARLVSEGIKPGKSTVTSKGFLRSSHESLIWVGGNIKAGFTDKQFGPFAKQINYINENGDFFWTQTIEYRRPGVHNDGGMNDVGRIKRPVFREIKPPRNVQKNIRTKGVEWSDRDDALEFAAYYVATSICSVPEIRNGDGSAAREPIVIDRSDGSVHFKWTPPTKYSSDEDFLTEEQRAPTIVPPRLEPAEDCMARLAARTIAIHRLNLE